MKNNKVAEPIFSPALAGRSINHFKRPFCFRDICISRIPSPVLKQAKKKENVILWANQKKHESF